MATKKWISEAIKKPGALRSAMGVKKGEKIPAKKLAAAAKKPGKMGQRARLAQTLGKLKKRSEEHTSELQSTPISRMPSSA